MSIERLLKPRKIAVFGGSHAREMIRQNERLGFDGEIWPVHPTAKEIGGRTVYRSVAELPGSPDAAYLGVNRDLTIDIVSDLARIGTGGVVCYASGFSEAGEKGQVYADRLLDAAGDMPLIGPMTYGLINYVDGVVLWPDQLGGRRVKRGVAVITMSSNVGFNLTMQRRGLPIAYMISLGNRLTFDLDEAIRTMADRECVSAIGLFLETIPDPHALERAVLAARDAGKPVVAVKIGRSEDARRMVVSHTASLAGSDDVAGALFARLGVARVGSLEAFVEALKVLHVLGPLRGRRVGAMSTSGGDLILLGDALGADLEMPALSEAVAEQVGATVHERVAAANPLDYQMFNWNDEERLHDTFRAFLADDFDIALCLLDYPRADVCDPSSWQGAERAFIRAVRETGTPGAVLATFGDTLSESTADRLAAEGVVALGGMDAGLAGIRAAAVIGAAWQAPPLPPLAPAGGGLATAGRLLDEAEAKALVARSGIPVPVLQVANSPQAAVAAAETLGYPVVVKALGVAHKTDAGAVRLDLRTASEVAAAVRETGDLTDRWLVEKMVGGAVAELLVGVAHESGLGRYLLVGGGGSLVEVLRDRAAILLPTSRAAILRALDGLQCAPLLQGFRGRPPADLEAAVDVVMAVARLVAETAPPILELDINPLILLPRGQGAVAADALVRMADCGSAGHASE